MNDNDHRDYADSESDIERSVEEIGKLKEDLFSKADNNIRNAQAYQKRDYDKKHQQTPKTNVVKFELLLI